MAFTGLRGKENASRRCELLFFFFFTCGAARPSGPVVSGRSAAYQTTVEGQSLVHRLTPPLRTVVRPVRDDAPQVPDAPLAEAVVALQGDGVGRVLVAQGTPGRGVQRCSHLVVVVVGDVPLPVSAITSGGGAGLNCLNPTLPPQSVRLKGSVHNLLSVMLFEVVKSSKARVKQTSIRLK